jgi:hypothetical protein
MTEDQWYYYHGGERQGPVTEEQLKQLASEGKVDPTDNVSKPGMTDWVQAGTIPDLFPPSTQFLPPPPSATSGGSFFGDLLKGIGRLRTTDDLVAALPHLRLLKAMLGGLRKVFSEVFLDKVDGGARLVGSISYIVAAVLILLAFAVIGIRSDSIQLFFVSVLGVALVAPVAHFFAAMFLGAGDTLLKKSPSALSSGAFPTCFGLCAFVGTVLATIGAFVLLLQTKDFVIFVTALGGAAVLCYLGGVALSPEAISVKVGQEASAGEEIIGIVMFLMKLPLRLVPFLFGVGCLVAALAGFHLVYVTLAEEAFMGQMMAMPIAQGLLGVALLPLLVYLAFLLLYLQLDLVRAILVVPGKLDALRREQGEA